MNNLRIAVAALIVAWFLGLADGSFRWTRETHPATLGPIALSVTEKQTVNLPLWLGIGVIRIGVSNGLWQARLTHGRLGGWPTPAWTAWI